MIAKPLNGWSSFKPNKKFISQSGSEIELQLPLSYIDDVADIFLDSLIFAKESLFEDAVLSFDAEGVTWKLVTDKYISYVIVEEDMCKFYILDLSLDDIALGLIEDFKRDIDDWCLFMDDEHPETYKLQMLDKLNRLSSLVTANK